MTKITVDELHKVDMRLGKIMNAELLPNPKYTTHKLRIDFGPEIGIKISGARVLKYTLKQLVGKLVIGIINLEPRQIGKIKSEVLTLGVPDKDGECILLSPDVEAPLGGKVY